MPRRGSELQITAPFCSGRRGLYLTPEIMVTCEYGSLELNCLYVRGYQYSGPELSSDAPSCSQTNPPECHWKLLEKKQNEGGCCIVPTGQNTLSEVGMSVLVNVIGIRIVSEKPAKHTVLHSTMVLPQHQELKTWGAQRRCFGKEVQLVTAECWVVNVGGPGPRAVA